MTRSRDFLHPGHTLSRHVLPRHGGLLVWVLPALAALALATLWLTTPGQPGPNTRPDPAAQSSVVPSPPTQLLPPSTNGAPVVKTPDMSQTSPESSASDQSQANSPSAKSLAEVQRAVTGKWTGFYQGQRQLTVLEGGKATMVVEPEGLGSILLAPKLTFEVLWKINENHLEFETVGGEPADKVDVVVKMYGKHRKHKIVDLKPERIVLLDEDGVTEYVWTRESR